MPLVKYVIWIVASPSISLCTFQYSICGLACGNVVSSTSSLSACVRNFSSTRAGIDQRVGPGELQRIDALFERDGPRFADQRQIFAVVNRQLHRVPLGHGRQIDIAGDADAIGDDNDQQHPRWRRLFCKLAS